MLQVYNVSVYVLVVVVLYACVETCDSYVYFFMGVRTNGLSPRASKTLTCRRLCVLKFTLGMKVECDYIPV